MTLVNLDKVLSGHAGNIESVIVYTAKAGTTENEKYTNGLFVALNGLAEGHREAKIAFPAEGTEDEILLVASPEVSYDERLTKEDFVNEKGSVARAYRMAKGDVIQVTTDLVPASTAKGHLLAVKKGKLVKIEDSAVATNALVFEVIEGESNAISNKDKSVALEVHKA